MRLAPKDFGRQQVSKSFEAGVDKESDVSGREAGDFRDLLIGETLLELEQDDFALIFRESPQRVADLRVAFLGFGGLVRLLSGSLEVIPLIVLQGLDAVFFPKDVERAIATDGEKPGFDAMADLGKVLLAELDERFLNDVACAIGVVKDGVCIADE